MHCSGKLMSGRVPICAAAGGLTTTRKAWAGGKKPAPHCPATSYQLSFSFEFRNGHPGLIQTFASNFWPNLHKTAQKSSLFLHSKICNALIINEHIEFVPAKTSFLLRADLNLFRSD